MVIPNIIQIYTYNYMKRNLITFFMVSICILVFGQQVQNYDKSFNTEVSNLKNEIESLKKANDAQNMALSNLNVEIINIKKAHDEQVEFYSSTQRTILWIVSIVFVVLSGIFSAFIWIFKKPEDIWRRLQEREKEIKQLLDRIEAQHQHQKLLFILGDKGLFDYDSEDWNIIEAIAKSSENISKKQRSEYDWFFIGLWWYKQRDFKKSIVAYKMATELNANFEIAYKNLANAYDEDGDFNNAIKYNMKVIELNPNSDKAHNNLGIVYGDSGNIEKATEYFIKAIKLKPDCGYYYTNLFEHCLVNNLPFDQKIEDTFIPKFKDDKLVFSIYQMFKIYQNITSGVNYKEQLDAWNKVFYSIGFGENFRAIEKWIDEKPEGQIKEGLKTAMIFFKEYQEL